MIGRVMMVTRCCAIGAALLVALAAGVSADDEMFRFDRTRKGQTEWTLTVGHGQTRYVTDNTEVPKIDFDVYGVRYAHFISSRSEVGYSFMVGEQTTQGRNTGISTFIDYSQMFYAKEHFAISYQLGIGVMRFKDKVPGQGSRTNFNERAGLTLHWATGPKTALSVSGSFYHASNAGLQLPNPGVNVALVLVNYTLYQ